MRRALLGAVLVLVGGSVVVQAAVSWSATSTVTTSVVSPPVVFEHGTNANNSRYVNGLTVSTNQTWFTGSFTSRAGADVTATDLVRLHNTAATPTPLTLYGTQVTNARVLTFEWIVKNETTTIGTLNHLAPSPSVAFTIPAGSTFTLDLRDVLAKGSGQDNAAITFAVWMVTS